MSYYNTCPECGAHLDPGEKCDCQDKDTVGVEHGEEVMEMYPDSVSICKVINHLLAVLNGRGHAVIDKENPERKLKNIIYNINEDKLYFECSELEQT